MVQVLQEKGTIIGDEDPKLLLHGLPVLMVIVSYHKIDER